MCLVIARAANEELTVDEIVLSAGFTKMKALTWRAAQEGARVVMGGHTEVPFAARGEAPWRELELLVESGFSPLEAIAAATGTAAAFLYRGDEIGRLRPGLQADLVVLREDPVRNIPRALIARHPADTGFELRAQPAALRHTALPACAGHRGMFSNSVQP